MSKIHQDIKLGTHIIGIADIYYEDDGVWLGNFEIFDKYRGKGLATNLLGFLISKYKIDSLIVSKNNDVALHLYRKVGFEVIDSYYAEDLGDDAFYMKRDNQNDIISL